MGVPPEIDDLAALEAGFNWWGVSAAKRKLFIAVFRMNFWKRECGADLKTIDLSDTINDLQITESVGGQIGSGKRNSGGSHHSGRAPAR